MSTYVIFDLEMCSVPKGPIRDLFPSSMELIQIGAVAMNEDYEIIDSYQTFVKPQFGRIDPFIRQLTGISNAQVQGAPSADVALKSFYDWLPLDATLVSWSRTDIKQIKKELKYKSIDIPGFDDFLNNSIDCQLIFSKKMSTRSQYKLSEALAISNVDYDEDMHDALVDARNTAKLFAKTQIEDELVLSPYYIRKEVLQSSRYDSFAHAYC